MKKLITAAVVALSFAGTASADPIYIDVGVDFGGNANKAAGSTTTGWIDQLAILYTSQSTITDNDNSGDLTAGDTILSTGGVLNSSFAGLGDIATNLVQGFEPEENLFGGPSNNDFISDWGLTFGFDDLAGFWTGTGMVYTSGTISMYYYDGSESSVSDMIRLFDLTVSAGGDTGTSTVLQGSLGNFGTLDVNGVDSEDVFNTALGSFGDYSSIPGNNVYFNASQDTQPLTGLNFVSGVAQTGGTHNGSINFSVPEPTSIAILGLGLLGLAGARRRKS